MRDAILLFTYHVDMCLKHQRRMFFISFRPGLINNNIPVFILPAAKAMLFGKSYQIITQRFLMIRPVRYLADGFKVFLRQKILIQYIPHFILPSSCCFLLLLFQGLTLLV